MATKKQPVTKDGAIRATFLVTPERWQEVRTMSKQSGLSIRTIMDTLIAMGAAEFARACTEDTDRKRLSPAEILFGRSVE